MDARSFLILHGWQGPGPEHWYTWLADRLRSTGDRVAFPTLPDADAPRLDDWHAVLRRELAGLDGTLKTVVTHSLGAVLWLHHVAGQPGPEPAADRVLLVAPPSPATAVPELRSFFPVALDADDVRRAASGGTRLVCSDDDPNCPEGAASAYGAPLGLQTDVIHGAGHINPDAGYGPWPDVEAWCRGERPRLVD